MNFPAEYAGCAEKPPSYLRSDKTLVMGILNVTPDSFSDGGKWASPNQAIEHGLELISQGADIIDVGGESTAPGRKPISATEEIDRIMPVIQGLHRERVLLSCDTLHADTAQVAVEQGVDIINDVSGGIADESMLSTVANLQDQHPRLSYICQHWRGSPEIANELAVYQNTPMEVWHELEDRIVLMHECGLDMRRVIIDPGLGFSKVGNQDWEILASLDTYLGRGYPVLVGPSRKRYLEHFETASPGRHPRDDATVAVALYCAVKGVWAVRVHNVPPVAVSLDVIRTLRERHRCRAVF